MLMDLVAHTLARNAVQASGQALSPDAGWDKEQASTCRRS